MTLVIPPHRHCSCGLAMDVDADQCMECDDRDARNAREKQALDEMAEDRRLEWGRKKFARDMKRRRN